MTQADPLAGGFAPQDDLMSPAIPLDDPYYRESVSMWLFDDSNAIQFPRFLIEDVPEDRSNRLVFYNIAFRDGRALVRWGSDPALPMEDKAGVPSIYGAGQLQFRCIEPFRHWQLLGQVPFMQTRAERLMFAAPEGSEIMVDLDIDTHSAAPLWVHGRMSMTGAKLMAQDSEERRFTGKGFRYEQLVTAHGNCRIGADEYRFKGRGLRIHRRSSRNAAGFRGHVWQSALFPSGKGFGYTAFPPGESGQPSFCEGYYFDGSTMHPAEPADIPWITLCTPERQDVSFTLRTAAGDIRIAAATGATNFSTARAAAANNTDPIIQQQGAALYTLGDETAFGMIERSNFRSKMTFRPDRV